MKFMGKKIQFQSNTNMSSLECKRTIDEIDPLFRFIFELLNEKQATSVADYLEIRNITELVNKWKIDKI